VVFLAHTPIFPQTVVASINSAADELESIQTGLLAVRSTLVTTIDTANQEQKVHQIGIWIDHIRRLMETLGTQIDAVEAGIAAERKHLMRQRETAYLEATDRPRTCL